MDLSGLKTFTPTLDCPHGPLPPSLFRLHFAGYCVHQSGGPFGPGLIHTSLAHMAPCPNPVKFYCAGYSVINGTVLVDLTGLDSFTPSPDHNSARVGTGNRLGPLYYKAWTQAGRLFPAGLCPYVGAGGHILGELISGL